MKKYIFTLLAAAGLTFTACDDILDRPQLNTPSDDTFWRTESDARMFAYSFYHNYFPGYSSGWSTAWATGPYSFYLFDDNLAITGKQKNFEDQAPSGTRGSSSETSSVLSTYAGENWNFAWVRKANIFAERLEANMKGNVSDEAYNHWHAVASFFKCYQYARLVNTFGDVPWFDNSFGTSDKDIMFKDRDPRLTVMDNVYDLCKNEVLVNMRTNDGTNVLNRYVAAAFISRWFLFEGTWQKYREGNTSAAQKYLQFAKEAAELVINSGNYKIASPLRDVFGSQDLKSEKECIMYRHYTSDNLKHCVASYSNGIESQANGTNLNFLRSLICVDGKPYQTSTVENAADFSLESLAQTRDPRFEASFYDHPEASSATLLYSNKCIDRNAWTLDNPGTVAMYGSNTNTNDCPVIRYAEVLLNWIEAKAELGGVSQEDIDKSINALRARPLDATAQAKGLSNTAPMVLSDITADFDPARDADVDPLIWEIRRERRLELAFEHCRLHDIKRWGKLMDYMKQEMNGDSYPDNMLGPWVKFYCDDAERDEKKYKDVATMLWVYKVDNGVVVSKDVNTSYVDKLRVQKEDGTVVTYDGTNAEDMEGYYIPTNASVRNPFYENSYLAPIGEGNIIQYSEYGYTLTQTKGW